MYEEMVVAEGGVAQAESKREERFAVIVYILPFARRISVGAFDRRIVHVRPVILDVVNVETELPEPQQVMKQLPDNPGERVPRRQMQHDDFALALAFHLCVAILARIAACGYPLELRSHLEHGNPSLADLGLFLVSKFAEITVAPLNNQH